MTVSISVEVDIPEEVSGADLVRIGKRCAPPEWRNGMTAEEALQWAFSDPGGVNMLATYGITWNTITTGVAKK